MTTRDNYNHNLSLEEKKDIASICEAARHFDPASPDILYRGAEMEDNCETSIAWHIFHFPFGGRKFTINVEPCDLTKFEVGDITESKLVVVMRMTVSVGELLRRFDFITSHQLSAIYHDAALRMDGVTNEEQG